MIHVLLAEDEIALAKIIKDSLESRRKFQITTAANGNEAMSLYHRSKPDILVLDVMMPQMDGFTLAKMIRQTDTQTPILFLTARSSVDDLVTGFHLGGKAVRHGRIDRPHPRPIEPSDNHRRRKATGGFQHRSIYVRLPPSDVTDKRPNRNIITSGSRDSTHALPTYE